MAGTGTQYNAAAIHQGPGDLWIIGGGVVDSATPQLTIATDGTPDATAHPASVHLGYTDSAIATAYVPKHVDIMVDQSGGPVARYGESEKWTLGADLKQLDLAILQQAASLGTYTTASGYTQLTFGGLADLPTVCVALIAKKRGAVGKFIVVILFSATGHLGISTSIGRAKPATNKVEFDALADLSRAAGRQLGVIYITK